MPTTRSQTSNDNHKDAVTDDYLSGKKRKAAEAAGVRPSKQGKKQEQKQKQKQASAKPPQKAGASGEQSKDDHGSDCGVVINRAPVLELWGASVAHFLHPSMPWSTCLSIGGAISTIAAISKGRAIGKMDKPDPERAQEKNLERHEKQANLDGVEVMGFHLHLDNGSVMVGDKPKKSTEDALIKKYGSDSYDRVKSAFATALATWKGREDDLNKEAFHMYEKMRPTVPPGQKGWGRKGELSLATIDRVVRSLE